MGKERCPHCGKKIGKVDRMKVQLMRRGLGFSEKAEKEFKEVETWCPKCIQNYFKPKFKEALGQLKEETIPKRFKGLVKKAEKEAEK